MRILIFCLIIFHSLRSASQPPPVHDSVFSYYEDSLKRIAPRVLHSPSEKERVFYNRELKRMLLSALDIPGSFFYPFDSLKTIARLISPDKRFRIFNWNLPYDDGTYEYSGILQAYDKKKKIITLFFLIDRSAETGDPDQRILSAGNWYGSLYYTLLFHKKSGKRYYTLLGWKGYSRYKTKKVIDVLQFAEDGTPFFGATVFKWGADTAKQRIIFEYNASVVMSLRWNPEKKRIVFDHLSPDHPNHEDMHEYYGPDFSYDALKFKRGKWTLIEDVDARNPAQKKPKGMRDPNKEKGLLPEK